MPFYTARESYPELRNIPPKQRHILIRKINRNNRDRGSMRYWVVITCLLMFIAIWVVSEMVGALINYRGIGFITAVVITGPLLVIGLYMARQRENRKLFLAWIDRTTFHGKPHYCLNCWQWAQNESLDSCPDCTTPYVRVETEREGTPPPRMQDPSHGSGSASINAHCPNRRTREEVSRFLLKDHEEFPAVLEIFGYIGIAEGGEWILAFVFLFAVTAVGLLIGFWWALLLGVLAVFGLVAYFIRAIWRSLTRETRMNRYLNTHYPDGLLTWCVYCDNDLHGHNHSHCPICGRKRYRVIDMISR